MNRVFEFDAAKSAANRSKHGIDFEEAQLLWKDGELLVGPAQTSEEPRWLAIGMIGDKHWTACFTLRGEAIRLISVRRARYGEIEHYES
jgi:uncharacterized protein